MSVFPHNLPCGIVDADGNVHRGIRLAGMSGKTRRLITSKAIRANASLVVTTILDECIELIEGVAPRGKSAAIATMLNGDRDWCAHRIREIGKRTPIVNCDYTCECGHEDSEEVDLGAIPIYGLSDSPGIAPESDGDDDSGTSYFTEWEWAGDGANKVRAYRLRDEALDLDCLLRWPTGKDFEAVQKVQETDPEKANFILFSRCLVEWCRDGKKVEPPMGGFKWMMFDAFDDGQITWLEDEWGKRQVGPEVFHPVTCVACGRSTIVTLSASDFLFPRPKNVVSRRRSFHKSV